ncbi:Extra-large guanine nucleotide-binding protein 1, partial [Mucuna pruriens]
MALLLKRLRRGVPSFHDDDDGGDYSYEYSFAEEYKGPPLSYSIPEVPPFNLHQIPFAHVAHSSPHHASLPIIQPFRKTNAELASSFDSSSSEPLSCKEDGDNGPLSPKHVKRPSVVTFRNPETNDMADDDELVESLGEESDSSSSSNRVRPHAVRGGKKGSCYRCLKGNRLTEREVCIVCSAKYCRNCVVRAMGSMPEGRKCVTCIGCRIDENNRGKLGKSSRMLKHLLSKWEVKQIMKDEMFCEANQIPAKHVRVNGEPLDWDQLTLLLTCSNPPKGLKPGFYWYDKASGYWGKEGQRPSQIISPQLEVGGDLQKNASHGKTNVTINGREITKAELRLLKWARVPCEGTTDFWVSHDGSYMEVGQKNVKGCIWKKAKILYNVPFSENERQNIKMVIQSNLFRYLGILLEAREVFEESLCQKSNGRHVEESTCSGITEEIDTTYSISPRSKAFSEWLLKYMVSGNLDAIFPAAAREYAPLVEELWRDTAIQATYNRRNEIKMLPRSASYFLDRAVEISRIDYDPSDMDILYAEGITLSNGLSSMEFSFTVSGHEDSLDPVYHHDPSLRYQLIRVPPKSLGENCKWLNMFEDIDVVLFSVALTDYDEYIVDSKGVVTNKILAAKQLFENIVTHTDFNKKKFLLILTKFDLLEEKVERVPLTQCEWFCDFHPVISHNHKTASIRTQKHSNHPPLAQRAFQYIGMKFKRLFHSLTDQKLFVSMVNGLEPGTVDEALRYAREVMVWKKWDPSLRNEKSEITSTTMEASSDEKYNNYYPS